MEISGIELEWEEVPTERREVLQCIGVEGDSRCPRRGYYESNGEPKGVWCDRHNPGGSPYRVADLDVCVTLLANALVSPSTALASAFLEATLVRLKVQASDIVKRPGSEDTRGVQDLMIGALDLIRRARASLLGSARTEFSVGYFLSGACASITRALAVI